MDNQIIITAINEKFPEVQFDESGEFLTINIAAEQFKGLAELLRYEGMGFDYLFCLTCVDWKTHLTMVYHLSGSTHRVSIVLKVNLDRELPTVKTVSDIWRTAEFHEREVFELFGVNFIDHPDLRKLILTDDFVGYPLRKDFEDSVNMIKL